MNPNNRMVRFNNAFFNLNNNSNRAGLALPSDDDLIAQQLRMEEEPVPQHCYRVVNGNYGFNPFVKYKRAAVNGADHNGTPHTFLAKNDIKNMQTLSASDYICRLLHHVI